LVYTSVKPTAGKAIANINTRHLENAVRALDLSYFYYLVANSPCQMISALPSTLRSAALVLTRTLVDVHSSCK